MLYSKSILGLAVVVALSGASLAETKVDAEKKTSPTESAVRTVVQQHIDGIVNADIKQLEQAWDTQAGQISFVSRNKAGEEVVQTGPITESFKLWTAKKSHGTRGTIQSVDIVNDRMALAKARITWNGQVFDDYLVLLKTDNDWKLISKTYTSMNASPYAVFAP